MTRHLITCTVAAVTCMAGVTAPAFAQFRPAAFRAASVSAAPSADVRGIVRDDRGQPLPGAVISLLGSTTVFAISDDQGRFVVRQLPYGPYLVRARLQGYVPPRARLIQVNRTALVVSAIALTRTPERLEIVPVLAAGVGAASGVVRPPDEPESHDHGEVAWRLRHLKRSVLKETAMEFMERGRSGNSFLADSWSGLERAVETSARAATGFFGGDVQWSGHLDLLTSTSFQRPQDLFAAQTWPPRGLAFVSLGAPAASGHWNVRGAVTQGDLSSWVVAGSYMHAPGPHRYQAGLSYAMQRYLGGNPDAVAAVPETGRRVGAVYTFDTWTVTPKLSVNYGAEYARYDYLASPSQFSPRAGLTVTPTSDPGFTVRASVSHRAIAPGAEEFIPPTSGLWFPFERTFSPVAPRRGFSAEHVNHAEIGAERRWMGDIVIGVRAFRQHVDNQLIALFGTAPPRTAAATRGHYYVASAGDAAARGWGVNVSRAISGRLRASLDYTRVASAWVRGSPDADILAAVAASVPDRGSFHDVTTSVDSTVPVTETRVVVVYKLNSRLSNRGGAEPRAGARFDIQLNQALPFLNFAGAKWEMLAAVRTLFRDDLLDASVYDEAFVVEPPKRVVGGVTVRF